MKLFKDVFSREPSLCVSCPGRVELLGNNNNENGGAVIGFATEQRIDIFASPREDRKICFYSDLDQSLHEYDLDNLPTVLDPLNWTAYPASVLLQMIKEGLDPRHGVNLFITSNLPYCFGLSSSAALEVGSGIVFKYLFDFFISAMELALICNRAEIHYTGNSPSILDQAVCACSEENSVTYIDCKQMDVESLNAPQQVTFWVFNTASQLEQTNQVSRQRLSECNSALKKLQDHYTVREHLVDYTLSEIDSLSNILSENEYKRAIHVVSEHHRVQIAATSLIDNNLDQIGHLLFSSHQSSKDFFEVSNDSSDFLVSRLMDHPQVYGARISDSGIKGSVIAMTNDQTKASDFQTLLDNYQSTFHHKITLLETKIGKGPSISFSM